MPPTGKKQNIEHIDIPFGWQTQIYHTAEIPSMCFTHFHKQSGTLIFNFHTEVIVLWAIQVPPPPRCILTTHRPHVLHENKNPSQGTMAIKFE